jgi:hypothetical protein
MPPTTWLEREDARTARQQPAGRHPRADRQLPAALREPVVAASVDPKPQPVPQRAHRHERRRLTLAVLAALSCLYLGAHAFDVSSALPFGGDPIPSEAGSAVRLAHGGAAVRRDRGELLSLARRAALERAATTALERGRDRDKPSGGGSTGAPGQGGSGGSGSDSDGQPEPEPPQGLLPPLPAPVPDVDTGDLPELDPSGTLPELPTVTLPELDPPLPTVESPVELP